MSMNNRCFFDLAQAETMREADEKAKRNADAKRKAYNMAKRETEEKAEQEAEKRRVAEKETKRKPDEKAKRETKKRKAAPVLVGGVVVSMYLPIINLGTAL